MTVQAQPVMPEDATAPVAVADTHATTEAAHGGGHESGGLPQFEFQHWFGQIVYLIFLFALLYFLIAKVFAPRLRRVFDEREQTITQAVSDARSVQAEAQGQAEAAQAELAEARAASRRTAGAAKARVAEDVARRQAEQEARLAERVGEAEGRIAAMRDKAMAQVDAVASDTTQAIVEKLTGKAASAAELNAAKGAA